MRPALLERWFQRSRLLVARITLGTWYCIMIVLYGYASGHSEQSTNEHLLGDIFTYTGDLTCPAMICGDYNMTLRSSPTLSACQAYRLWKINDEKATTKSRGGLAANHLALDHCVCNSKMLDLGLKMEVSTEWSLSDHFPLVGGWHHPKSHMLVWNWPMTSVLGQQAHDPPWDVCPTTYTEWCECARAWLMAAHETNVPAKNCLSASFFLPKNPSPDLIFSRLSRLEAAISHVKGREPTVLQKRSLGRKARQLHIVWQGDLDLLERLTATMKNSYLEELQL